jgi:hypothetical protein
MATKLRASDMSGHFFLSLRFRQFTPAFTPVTCLPARTMSSADKENLPANNDETGGQVTAPKGASHQPSKSTKTVWKSQDSALLIETLLKEREAGHQSDTGFCRLDCLCCCT